MVTLQYQTKPDVVRLVERLDKACIRFVHFSKENELRSRVFAEKMGLEAGWNCHISLATQGSATLSPSGKYYPKQSSVIQATPNVLYDPRIRMMWQLVIDKYSVRTTGKAMLTAINSAV